MYNSAAMEFKLLSFSRAQIQSIVLDRSIHIKMG